MADRAREIHRCGRQTLSGVGFDNLAYAEYRVYDERHGYESMFAHDELAGPVPESKITDPHVDKVEFEAKRGTKRVRFGRVGDVALSGWWVEVLELSDPSLQEWTSVFSASLLETEDVRWILGVQIGADYGTLLTDVVN